MQLNHFTRALKFNLIANISKHNIGQDVTTISEHSMEILCLFKYLKYCPQIPCRIE